MTKDQADAALAVVGNSLREQRDRAETALAGLVEATRAAMACTCAEPTCPALTAVRAALTAMPADLAARVEARIRAQALREAADVCWSHGGPTGDVEAEKAARS